MTTDRAQRSYCGSGVFVLVSIPSGGLAGAATMLFLAPGLEGLYLVALGFGAGVVLAVFGVAAPGALTITAIIVVGLTLSAVAPWRGGFARRIEGPAAPTADPGVGA